MGVVGLTVLTAAVLTAAVLTAAALLHWQVPERLLQNSAEAWHWVERSSWLAAGGSLIVAVPLSART